MKLNPEDVRPESDKDPLELFHIHITSPNTDKKYTSTLRLFLCKVLEDILHGTFEERAKEFVEIGRNDPQRMRGILLGLSGVMRERTKKKKNDSDYLNPSSILTYFNPIKKLLNANDVTVNWKRVSQTFPERDNMDDSRDWTLEEIRCVLEHARDIKYRAMTLVLASSGVRCGGLLLRWGDITRIYDVDGEMVKEKDVRGRVPDEPACAAVRVYRGSASEYVTFITPEAYGALMDYADSWADDMGRRPRPEDPIFKGRKVPSAMMSEASISGNMAFIVSTAGVRGRRPDNPRRCEVPLLNGFRRFFNKTMKDSVPIESPLSVLMKVEFMMGHVGLTGLDPNYYKTNPEKLAAIYVNAIPGLTISESERSRQADRHGDKVIPGLDRSYDRISRLEEMNQSERIGLLAGMLDHLSKGKFADSDDPA